MQVQLRLVHAEPGSRVVEASAIQRGEVLAMALGEASTAEEAEQRARGRLQEQLQALPRPGQAPGPAAPALTTPPSPVQSPPAQLPQPSSQQSPLSPQQTPAPSPPSEAEPSPQAPSGEEPAPDPDDWSAELARIDLALKRIGWQREQEGQYLERAFGHPSRSRLTTYHDLLAYLRQVEALEPGCDPLTTPVPLRRGELLRQSDALLQQLGWDPSQGRHFLERHLGKASRQQLNEAQLLQFNLLLEEELMGAGPVAAVAAAD
jgi:hypothetical protein